MATWLRELSHRLAPIFHVEFNSVPDYRTDCFRYEEASIFWDGLPWFINQSIDRVRGRRLANSRSSSFVRPLGVNYAFNFPQYVCNIHCHLRGRLLLEFNLHPLSPNNGAKPRPRFRANNYLVNSNPALSSYSETGESFHSSISSCNVDILQPRNACSCDTRPYPTIYPSLWLARRLFCSIVKMKRCRLKSKWFSSEHGSSLLHTTQGNR